MGSPISRLSSSVSKPESGLYGWIAIKLMQRSNPYLERNAVSLCNIKPDFKVLEVGFGEGVGLEHANSFVKDGSGEIHGTDISERMRNLASSRLQQQIADGKVHLHSYSVDKMAFEDGMFDCAYHCNCYYFWPDMDKAVSELRRVLKPGGLIVSTLNMRRLQSAIDKGFQLGNPDPHHYINALKSHNFTDVEMVEHYDENMKQSFHAITAKLPNNM